MARLKPYFQMQDIVGSVLLALILSVSQAFDTMKDLHFLASFGIWIIIVLPVWMLDAVPIRWILQMSRQPYLMGLMLAMSVALIASFPQTLYIQSCFKFMVHETVSFEIMFIRVLAISLSVTVLVYVLVGGADNIVSRNTSTDLSLGASNPKLLTNQLPPEIGGNIMSMHAEDHYLRIVTDKGEALVLMRLRDAIGAMNTDDGMQTHRSHWVSTSSNPVLIRQNGKPTLQLFDGRMVPVSRQFLSNVRAALSAKTIPQ